MYNGLAPPGAAAQATGIRHLSQTLYLVVMVSVIACIMAVTLPVLLLKRCEACGKWNVIDAAACRKCGAAFNGRE